MYIHVLLERLQYYWDYKKGVIDKKLSEKTDTKISTACHIQIYIDDALFHV